MKLLGFIALGIAVCAAAQSSGYAVIRGTSHDSNAYGFVRFEQRANDKFDVHVWVENLSVNPNGDHAVHVHSWGDVADPSGDAAGDVLNPLGSPQGCPGKAGPRPVGNMGNWRAVGGQINQTKTLDQLDAVYIAGRTVIVHSEPDDCVSNQPRGRRLAQGVIGISEEHGAKSFEQDYSLVELVKLPSKMLLQTPFGRLMDAHVKRIEGFIGDAANSTNLDLCNPVAPLWGALGSSLGVAFANFGAAYGLAASFFGYISLAMTPRVDRLMLVKGLVPGIMASVRGVYGLIIAILVTVSLKEGDYPLIKGFAQLYAGLCVGLTGVASGYCMGVIGNFGLKAVGKKSKLYINVLLIIIFCEAIGLYGLIIALILVGQGGDTVCTGDGN